MGVYYESFWHGIRAMSQTPQALELNALRPWLRFYPALEINQAFHHVLLHIFRKYFANVFSIVWSDGWSIFIYCKVEWMTQDCHGISRLWPSVVVVSVHHWCCCLEQAYASSWNSLHFIKYRYFVMPTTWPCFDSWDPSFQGVWGRSPPNGVRRSKNTMCVFFWQEVADLLAVLPDWLIADGLQF